MENIYKTPTTTPWISTSTIIILIVILFVGTIIGKFLLAPILETNQKTGYLIYGDYMLYKEGKLGGTKAKGRKAKEHWSMD